MRAQQVEHDRLHRVVVDAEHELADDRRAPRRPTGRATRSGRGRRRPGGRQAHLRGPPSRWRGRRASGCPSTSRRAITVVEPLVEPALALAPRPQHAADDHRRLAAAAPQVGQHGPLDHLLHLVRHAGHGVDDLVDARPYGQISPGAVPRVCGMTVAPTGTSAWRRLFAGHRAGRASANMLADHVGDGVVRAPARHAHHRGDRLAGEVVVGRPEPTAHDHRVGVLEQRGAARPRCGRGCRRP